VANLPWHSGMMVANTLFLLKSKKFVTDLES